MPLAVGQESSRSSRSLESSTTVSSSTRFMAPAAATKALDRAATPADDALERLKGLSYNVSEVSIILGLEQNSILTLRRLLQ